MTRCVFLVKEIFRLSPLFLCYVLVVLIFSTSEFDGDEGRYVMYATNLTNGYYSPPDRPDLWNGPGYSIVLVPFVFFQLPWMAAKLMNPLFLFLAVVYFNQTLHLYVGDRATLALSYVFGMYPPFLRLIHMLLPETFVFFLVCGFMFHFCKAYRQDAKEKAHLVLASLFLGYLAMTKIFFGYVIMAGLALFVVWHLIKRIPVLKMNVKVYALAFFICTPWLIHTYSITGKVLFWGNSGGMSLYWMASPYEGDLGDWHSFGHVLGNPELFENHLGFFERLSKLDRIQRDEEFKKKAVEFIIGNPKKFVSNWMANMGRLLFSYPFSHTPQKMSTFFYLVPNMFIVVISILCIYPSFVGRSLIPLEIWSLFGVFLISLLGSSVLSAYDRQFRPLVPFLSLWIIITMRSVAKIELRR